MVNIDLLLLRVVSIGLQALLLGVVIIGPNLGELRGRQEWAVGLGHDVFLEEVLWGRMRCRVVGGILRLREVRRISRDEARRERRHKRVRAGIHKLRRQEKAFQKILRDVVLLSSEMKTGHKPAALKARQEEVAQ
jgi:hypothetical protein